MDSHGKMRLQAEYMRQQQEWQMQQQLQAQQLQQQQQQEEWMRQQQMLQLQQQQQQQQFLMPQQQQLIPQATGFGYVTQEDSKVMNHLTLVIARTTPSRPHLQYRHPCNSTARLRALRQRVRCHSTCRAHMSTALHLYPPLHCRSQLLLWPRDRTRCPLSRHVRTTSIRSLQTCSPTAKTASIRSGTGATFGGFLFTKVLSRLCAVADLCGRT